MRIGAGCKLQRKQIKKRCVIMKKDFKLKKQPKNEEVHRLGRDIKDAQRKIEDALRFADKYFYKSKDEHKLLEEVYNILDLYRCHMDDNPVEEMLPGASESELNSVFYGEAWS